MIKPIEDYPGYSVSTSGRVFSSLRQGRRPRGEEATPRQNATLRELVPNTSGPYSTIGLRRDSKTITRYVHHVVLETFVGPCPDGMECLHRDCNKRNNSLGNLRWGTSLENSADTMLCGRQAKGERVAGSRLKATDIAIIHELRSQGMKHKDIANRLGVSRVTITLALNGKTWRSMQTLTLVTP